MDFLSFRYPLSFSSFEFVLAFLPVVYGGFVLANRVGGWTASINFLVAASFAFYGLFGLNLLAILVGSITVNFLIARAIISRKEDREVTRNLMIGGIAVNLLALGYLKYSDFLVGLFGSASAPHAVNVIGVSFFTFIQIGYLIDAFNGQLVRHDFARYALFSAFFPCVTAGPLVLQNEFMRQLDNPAIKAFDLRRVAVGLTMFGFGMFKKVVLADQIAPFANAMFNGVTAGAAVDPVTAWVGTLCYTLQLYFDFSGYSDMAIGLGLIFGIKLPLNFNSPFKTTNISDFWRNWHMTMTRFFTNYIYTGLAMNGMRRAMTGRVGRVQKYVLTAAVPAIVTFMVAGVWHGSGMTFAVYGLLHGCAIAGYLAWREFSGIRLPAPVAWFCTMAVVVTGLVIFRSPNMTTAATVLASMWNPLAHLGGTDPQAFAGFVLDQALSMVIILGAVTLLLPNTQQVLHLDWPTSDMKPQDVEQDAGLLAWRPKMSSAFVTALTYAIALTSIGSGTSFLYYNF
jgi:alginate O-acetyltransferase complex protein AlgI